MSDLRKRDGGIQPYYGLLPSCEELERGKTQEFKERKVYDITHSHMKIKTRAAAEEENSVQASGVEMGKTETRTYLFTTKTCPNCKIAVSSLEKAQIPYEVIDAEEHTDLVKKYGVMQAPTLVVDEGQ